MKLVFGMCLTCATQQRIWIFKGFKCYANECIFMAFESNDKMHKHIIYIQTLQSRRSTIQSQKAPLSSCGNKLSTTMPIIVLNVNSDYIFTKKGIKRYQNETGGGWDKSPEARTDWPRIEDIRNGSCGKKVKRDEKAWLWII